MPKLKNAVVQRATENYENAMRFYSLCQKTMGKNFRPGRVRLPDGSMSTQDEIEEDITGFATLRHNALPCKTILFSSEQCDVFWKLIDKGDVPQLEYRLPFPDVILEFTQPFTMVATEKTTIGIRTVLGMMLTQVEVDKQRYETTTESIRQADKLFGFADSKIIPADWSKSDTITFNRVGLIDKEFDVEQIAWTSQMDYTDIVSIFEDDRHLIDWRLRFKALAIACIGYINCENIYLERVEQASETINAKRERKGKSKLEPYYICRIRGVQYDSAESTGTGVKHGIRYDVRGHFRRLQTGKTIWVRPHQRGLMNELYVPKTYLVDKRP